MTVENGIFILGYSFEEICYSQLVKIIFPAIFGVCVGGGAVRWRKCLELVSLCKAPLERHLQKDCLDCFTAPSQEKRELAGLPT